jgi:hypothetical protein
MFNFYDWDSAFKVLNRRIDLTGRFLQNSPDVVKKFKEAAEADKEKMGEPADKSDVRKIQQQIQKKQESYVQVLGQRIDKLTTEMAVLRNSQNEFQQNLRGWADSVNGQLRFTYAISKKADLFMKEKQSTDPFSVAPRYEQKTRVEKTLGTSQDPFSVQSREDN